MKRSISQVIDNEWETCRECLLTFIIHEGHCGDVSTHENPRHKSAEGTLEAISVTTSYVKKIVYEEDDVAHTAAESAFIITMKQALLFRINGCLPELI